MAFIDSVIDINIGVNATAIPQASFSIPLIIGPTAPTTGIMNSYFSPAAMLSNGYTISSPEYVYAEEMFEQQVTPTEFFVGKRTSVVAQVDTLAVATLDDAHLYQFTLNGSVISYQASGSDTQQAILSALLADIATAFPLGAPVTGVVTGTGSGALLTLTDSKPGLGFSISAVDADLTHVALTPSNGIADDLAKLIAVNNSWYGIVLCSNSDNDILQLAAAVEGLTKIFIAASSDSAIATSSTTDLMSVLKGKSYKRTALVFSPASDNLGIDAAWMGGQLPLTPGSNNWAWQTLAGISPDSLTDNQIGILVGNPAAQVEGKNANIYTTIGGVNATLFGQMAGGQYIDITVGVDWLKSQIQVNILESLKGAAALNSKVPYTDLGVSVFEQDVRAAIDLGVTNGLINGADDITVSAPLVASVPINQRAGRLAPTISFSCTLAGAINSVKVNGTVSV